MNESHRVVVRSVGTASPALSAALAQALPVAQERLARCLYQAPAVLLDGLSEPQAHTIRNLLAQTGIDVAVASANEALELGGPELELAVQVGDFSRFRGVAVVLARFLGCDLARAVKLLIGMPPVVLGHVSRATAAALSQQLEPLGAEVDVSVSAEARYDIFVDEGAGQLRQRIVRQLSDLGVEARTEGPIVALGVARQLAQKLWARIGSGAGWNMLDQAFQRFDVILSEFPHTSEAAAALVAVTGMPATLVPKLRTRLPLVVLSGIRAEGLARTLHQLAEARVDACARLITLSRWDLTVVTAPDAAGAAEILAQVLGRERAALQLQLRRLPARLDVSVGVAQGQWLLHELSVAGARAVLEDR